jgi:DNA replication protein DnaC
MSLESFQTLLKSLRLTTAAHEIPQILADYKKAVNLSWAIDLLQREVDSRREKYLQRRLHCGNFQLMKALEQFDWDFNPKINRDGIMGLASLDFIGNKEIVLFLGLTGTGKTHLAEALGLKAVLNDYKVYCTSMKKLSEDIDRSLTRNDLPSFFKKILSNDLLILDDWGTVSLPRKITEEVFDLLDRRRLSTAMILTSNRDVKEWPSVFSDPILASAAIDRIFDRATIEEFEGKSYRLSGNKEKNVTRKKEVVKCV